MTVNILLFKVSVQCSIFTFSVYQSAIFFWFKAWITKAGVISFKHSTEAFLMIFLCFCSRDFKKIIFLRATYLSTWCNIYNLLKMKRAIVELYNNNRYYFHWFFELRSIIITTSINLFKLSLFQFFVKYLLTSILNMFIK